jgi:hypothetical protein
VDPSRGDFRAVASLVLQLPRSIGTGPTGSPGGSGDSMGGSRGGSGGSCGVGTSGGCAGGTSRGGSIIGGPGSLGRSGGGSGFRSSPVRYVVPRLRTGGLCGTSCEIARVLGLDMGRGRANFVPRREADIRARL